MYFFVSSGETDSTQTNEKNKSFVYLFELSGFMVSPEHTQYLKNEKAPIPPLPSGLI